MNKRDLRSLSGKKIIDDEYGGSSTHGNRGREEIKRSEKEKLIKKSGREGK